jgi:hypothetical protein
VISIPPVLEELVWVIWKRNLKRSFLI